MKLLLTVYPLPDQHPETLTVEGTNYANILLATIKARARLDHIDPDLLGLDYDGLSLPLPYPDIHWDLVAAWSIIDGTIPAPIMLKDGTTIDYTSILLKEPSLRSLWSKKVHYASAGFRLR